MSDIPDIVRLREVAAEMQAMELVRVLNRAVMNYTGWKREAADLLAKIDRGEFEPPVIGSFW